MQRFIMKCLGYESPIYGHFPVLVGADGTKLSKQTFAEPVDWTRPGETFALISRLLLLNDTPGLNEHAQVWLDYFYRWTISSVDCQGVRSQYPFDLETRKPSPNKGAYGNATSRYRRSNYSKVYST